MNAKKIRVDVTCDDIRLGVSTPGHCPIARAIKRVQKKYVEVWDHTVKIDRQVFCLPKRARRFVERFDSEQRVRPITFELI